MYESELYTFFYTIDCYRCRELDLELYCNGLASCIGLWPSSVNESINQSALQALYLILYIYTHIPQQRGSGKISYESIAD